MVSVWPNFNQRRVELFLKWSKPKKIFDPQFCPSFNGIGFAQSPQVLPLENGDNRVFYSTRVSDADGLFLSHIKFCDFDSSFERIIAVSDSVAIDLGKPGCFDEHGIFPLNVVRLEGRILGYICGWNRSKSVPVNTAIGLCESFDGGHTFKRLGDGPILSASPNEPFLVGDPFVLKIESEFHMWYIFGKKWIKNSGNPDRVYKIGHAVSSNGVDWVKPNDGRCIVSDVLDENECQALPTVFNFNGYWHMIFCFRNSTDFRQNPKNGYKLGYAYSFDAENWIRNDRWLGLPSGGEWDNEMRCYPNVSKNGDLIALLYNGNAFGKFGFGVSKLDTQSYKWRIGYDEAAYDDYAGHFKNVGGRFLARLEALGFESYCHKLNDKAHSIGFYFGEDLVGCCAYYVNGDEAFVSSFSVVQAHQSQKIGKLLLDCFFCKCKALGLTHVSLETFSGDESPASFYLKNGFVLSPDSNHSILRMEKAL